MEQGQIESPGLYHGVYSYHEAARLLNVATQRISRWADGYSFQLKYGKGKSKPVLQTERHQGVLSFDELFELFFVREYVALGVKLQEVRATAESLAKEVGRHPFAQAKLIVGGRHLFVEHAEGMLKRADIGQVVADFADWMKQRVEFRDESVSRYMPPEFGNHIYLDKSIRGGEAVITDHAIPTRVIYGLWEQETNLATVADYHDIDVSMVSLAVRYEGQWRLSA